jgi:hypothetical protein
LVDGSGVGVEHVNLWLAELYTCDSSPATIRAYTYDLLGWTLPRRNRGPLGCGGPGAARTHNDAVDRDPARIVQIPVRSTNALQRHGKAGREGNPMSNL